MRACPETGPSLGRGYVYDGSRVCGERKTDDECRRQCAHGPRIVGARNVYGWHPVTDSWRICLVGLVLGLSVPAVAWLEESTLLLLLVAIVLVAFAVLLFAYYRANTKNKAEPII